jgi:hypothetical protein
VTALPLMWSEIGPQFTLACKMPGEIVVASKRSALKEAPAAQPRHGTETIAPADRSNSGAAAVSQTPSSSIDTRTCDRW